MSDIQRSLRRHAPVGAFKNTPSTQIYYLKVPTVMHLVPDVMQGSFDHAQLEFYGRKITYPTEIRGHMASC